MNAVVITRLLKYQTIRFSILTIVSLVANLTVSYGLFYLGIPEAISFAIALMVVFFINFSGCRWFVFLTTGMPIRRQLLKYAYVNGSFRLLEYSCLLVLSTFDFANYYTRVITVLASSFVLKFFIYGKFVFCKFRPS